MGIDLGARRQGTQSGPLMRDRPQIRLFLSQPVEEQHALGLAGNLAGIESGRSWAGFALRGSFRQPAQAL